MTINVTNQKPAILDPVHTIACSGDYDPMPVLAASLIEPLYAPLNAAGPVSIADGKGNQITQDDAVNWLMSCFGTTINTSAEQAMKELLGQTMINFETGTLLPVKELFAIQAGKANKMQLPTPAIMYTARDDVIPAAKGLLANQGTNDEQMFFASLAYTYHPDTLGVWFQSETEFQSFQTWLTAQTQPMASVLSGTTNNLLVEFSKLTLTGLTESLLLRKDDSDGNEEFSFARLIIHMLMSYIQQRQGVTSGLLPFSADELFCPKSLVLVNVEVHARATPNKVNREWKLINQSLQSPVRVVSNKKLSKLTALARATQRAKAMASMAAQGKNINGRSAKIVFRKLPPTNIDLFKEITRVLKHMGTVNRSQNVFRDTTTTFRKANRRDPSNYNLPGKTTSTRYMPDIHLYIDTSGSISEVNYQEVVTMLIRVAKKLNVNLYFNTFSHLMSQETMLKIEGRSTKQIWNTFRKMPKVTGGTNFKQIWDYINASPTRKRRMSLVITDFEWTAPSSRQEHPKNIYYAPCSAMDWDDIVYYAQQFAKSMQHIDGTTGRRLLGLRA